MWYTRGLGKTKLQPPPPCIPVSLLWRLPVGVMGRVVCYDAVSKISNDSPKVLLVIGVWLFGIHSASPHRKVITVNLVSFKYAEKTVKCVFEWLMSWNIALVFSCLGELEEAVCDLSPLLPSLLLYHELWLCPGCGSRAFPAWHREAKQAATLRCDRLRGGATPQRHEPAVS